MKKNLLWLAGAAALVACSQTEFDTTSETIVPVNRHEMKLSVYQQGQTRATASDTLKWSGFQLAVVRDNKWYDSTAADYTNTTGSAYVVSYSEGTASWGFDLTTPDWPADASTTLDFCAWNREWKKDITGAAGATVTPIGTFNPIDKTLSLTVPDYWDLVTAYLPNQKYSSNNGTVDLSFNHALAQLVVQAVAPNSEYVYEITSVGVSNPRTVVYDFAAGEFSVDGSVVPTDYNLFTGNQVVGEIMQTMGSIKSLVPNVTTVLTVTYDVKNLTGGPAKATHTSSLDITDLLTKGKILVLTVTLPVETGPMTLSSSYSVSADWTIDPQSKEM